MHFLRIQLILSAAMLFCLHASATVLYVDANSVTPAPPYTNWSIAANNIQSAVDAATNGDTVLVTNGVYATGGRKWVDSGTNRVTLTNSITLRSVNGPAFTFIVGGRAVGGVLATATRCVGMGRSAVLSGFTLTNGQAGTGNYPAGGGVAMITGSAVCTVTNCILINNLATNSTGGGASRVTLINCRLIGNSAAQGGGASGCALINCLVVSNTATSIGGGIQGNSTLGNVTATNCTIIGNSATTSGGGVDGGGGSTIYNCILYFNTAPSGSNYANIKINYCCTVPLQTGGGNFSNPPAFVDFNGGNFRLASNSPCINTGTNSYVTLATDLDGRPRIIGGTVDVGAYEFQTNADSAFIGWLQRYSLPADGSADTLNSDNDGLSNWQEFLAGTDPTDAASTVAMNTSQPQPELGRVAVTWQGVATRTYFLQRSSDLSGGFSTIATNLPGSDGVNLYYDLTATNGSRFFYRIGVQ